MTSKEGREKKSTDAQINASVKYNRSRDNIMIRPTEEEGSKIRNAAKNAGQPVQQYILQAIRERMEREMADAPRGYSISDRSEE